MNRCLQKTDVPEWKTKGKTTLIQKDLLKRTTRQTYRPITYLPMMWKILTSQIRVRIYYSLTSHGLFLEEEKECRKGSRGTGELLYIDLHILYESKTRWKNLAMAWIDYKKAYDVFRQSWILSQKAQNIRQSDKLYRQNHENLVCELDSRKEKLSLNKDLRSYILRSELSPLLFIVAIMPLNHILRKCTARYRHINRRKRSTT